MMPGMPRRNIPDTALLGFLGLFALAAMLWASLTGPTELSLLQASGIVLAKTGLISPLPADSPAQETIFAYTAAQEIIFWDIRLPRAVLALIVGMGLGMAGAALQGLFRNPLADPGLIGVSGGAAVGGVSAIVFGSAMLRPEAMLWLLPLSALAGALITTWLIYQMARVGGRVQVATLLLTGIAVNAIAAAYIGLALTVYAGHSELRSIALWTLGSLSQASWMACGTVLLPMLPAVFVLFCYRGALNAFLLGESEAFHLGYDVSRVRRHIIAACAITVGATVAVCGIIGFIGLIVPHLIRLLAGPNHRILLPASALLGGGMLVTADIAARTLAAPAELQIGILTALIGGPFFLALLLGQKKRISL